MNKSQKEYYRQFSQHGTGDARIEISASEVALLLFIAYHDIYDTFPSQEFPPISKLACKDFYKITFEKWVVSNDVKLSNYSTAQTDWLAALSLCGQFYI